MIVTTNLTEVAVGLHRFKGFFTSIHALRYRFYNATITLCSSLLGEMLMMSE